LGGEDWDREILEEERWVYVHALLLCKMCGRFRWRRNSL